MAKVLYVHCVDSHIQNFHIPYLKLFKENNYEVFVVTNGSAEIKYCDYHYTLPFKSSPFDFSNLRALRGMINLYKDIDFDYIILNGAIGGIVGRLAALFTKQSAKLVYFVHGFPFHENGNLLHNFIYGNIENSLLRLTDIVIVTNQDDFDYIYCKRNKYKLECYYMPGVGIDLSKEVCAYKERKLFNDNFNINDTDFVLLTAGEFIKRKNHVLLFNTLRELNDKNIKLLICGDGFLKKKYIKYINKYHIGGITFLGYCDNLSYFMRHSDVFVFPSVREGLPVSIELAMANDLPVIASDIKGNRDLITDDFNGYLFNEKDEFVEKILKLKESKETRERFARESRIKIEEFQLEKTESVFKKIFFKEK